MLETEGVFVSWLLDQMKSGIKPYNTILRAFSTYMSTLNLLENNSVQSLVSSLSTLHQLLFDKVEAFNKVLTNLEENLELNFANQQLELRNH